jgi:hypothetical protein
MEGEMIEKNDFHFLWKKDWVLRLLIINHFLFWRNSRKQNFEIDQLKYFLARHTLAQTKNKLEDILKIYSNYEIFTHSENPDKNTGLINPSSFEIIKEVMLNDYNLDLQIKPNYNVIDFLWGVYNHNFGYEKIVIQNLSELFNNVFGFSTEVFSTGKEKDKHDYLKLTWIESEKKYAWWIGFTSGNYLKREDSVAEGLITNAVMGIRLFSTTSTHFDDQFWTLCALEFGDTAINTCNQINSAYNFEHRISLILLLSFIKLFTYGDKNRTKQKRIISKFSNFINIQDFEKPLNVSKGIEAIENSLRQIKE